MLEEIRKSVPTSSGCYIYYNNCDEVIYVGKAKNLKNRMSSYFNKSHDLKTTKLVSAITRFEYVITNSENEALILENNLIKKYNPKFNILLKDDKSYPYILITDELYPRLIKVRSNSAKGIYYGPFASGSLVNMIIVEINRMIQLRKCQKLPQKECIYYHLKQCYAPCILPVTVEETKAELQIVKDLLKNDMKNLKKHFESQMQMCAEKNQFEEAMRYRDLLKSFDAKTTMQAVEFEQDVNVDIVGIYKDESTVSVNIISVINGKAERFRNNLVMYTQDYQEAVIACLYREFGKQVPMGIICNDEKMQRSINSYFNIERYKSHLPKLSELGKMAYKNAADYYIKNIDKFNKMYIEEKNAGFEALKKLAANNLSQIEMIDISHLDGDAQVGAAIVYTDGVKNKSKYRKYKISAKNIRDEYGSMREVIHRRIRRMIETGEKLPDLIILDGGKGQVGVGLEVLTEFKLVDQVMLLGLVKDDNHKTKGMINKNMEFYELKPRTKLYRFLYELQEEVHRYALDFHHRTRTNSMISSFMDEIPGIGPTRKKKIFNRFKTVDAIASAEVSSFLEISINKRLAEAVINAAKEVLK